MTDRDLFIYLREKSDYEETGNDVDYSIEFDCEKEEINVYFKESDSDTDWKENFSFLPAKLKIGNKSFITTRGYRAAYESSYNRILPEIVNASAVCPTYTVNFKGWSFGSAMCLLYALAFYEVTGKKSYITTFGRVKIFYTKEITEYLRQAADVTEYANINDFVTWCVPFCHSVNTKRTNNHFSLIQIFRTSYWHQHYDEVLLLPY